jgi:hypothetical protein
VRLRGAEGFAAGGGGCGDGAVENVLIGLLGFMEAADLARAWEAAESGSSWVTVSPARCLARSTSNRHQHHQLSKSFALDNLSPAGVRATRRGVHIDMLLAYASPSESERAWLCCCSAEFPTGAMDERNRQSACCGLFTFSHRLRAEEIRQILLRT